QYLTQLHTNGKSPSSIAQVVAAVKWKTRSAAWNDIVGIITTKTLAGIRRDGRSRGRGQVKGLTWEDVEKVCACAESTKTLAGLRDSAMMRLMSDCLLRISETVAVDVEDTERVLTLWSSKTDQQGSGETLYIGDETLKVIRRYRIKGAIHSGALFRGIRRGDHITDSRLTANSAREAIKRRTKQAGIEGFISGHSLRVGTAISLAKTGATVVEMQTAGRWKDSKMPAHYARAELAERGVIARFKYGKGRE
ncbi:MAG: tyrosine-type recombinase/integrase, partial [Candidatus Poribacteria bacterium]|nr:tyrosine-type recombinase/integrase [Candidatus Poribacteria bacterium]